MSRRVYIDEAECIGNIYAVAAEATLEMGGVYTRPYGVVTDMVYERATSYTRELKKLKKLMDPNNIMAPGRLCF